MLLSFSGKDSITYPFNLNQDTGLYETDSTFRDQSFDLISGCELIFVDPDDNSRVIISFGMGIVEIPDSGCSQIFPTNNGDVNGNGSISNYGINYTDENGVHTDPLYTDLPDGTIITISGITAFVNSNNQLISILDSSIGDQFESAFPVKSDGFIIGLRKSSDSVS